MRGTTREDERKQGEETDGAPERNEGVIGSGWHLGGGVGGWECEE